MSGAPDIGLAVNRATGQAPPARWPDPDLSLLDEHIILPPPFPVVLPTGWMNWTIDAAESAGCPVDYVPLPLLTVTGTLIGNARWGQPWEGWAEPPAVFTAEVGRPSSGKSAGLDAVTKLLAQLEVEINTDWDDRRRSHKRDVAAAKERRALWERDVKTAVKNKVPPPDMPADAEDPEPPSRRRLLSVDPTVEKAARLNLANPRGLLLVRDELAGWIDGMDRYSRSSGSDRPFWLQAYGGRHWTRDLVKDGDRELIVPHLLWGVCGGIQPDRIASQLLVGDDDGLAARLIYSWPTPVLPRRPNRVPDPTLALDALRRIVELPWQPPDPIILPFTDAAAATLQAFREEAADLEGSVAGMFLSWIGKLPGFCLRLAVIIQHLAWCWGDPAPPPPTEIEEWAVASAADFLEQYAVPMARRVFGKAALPQAERDARNLGRWLVRQTPVPETINSRDLRRMASGPGIRDVGRMNAALDELAEAGWVRPAPARAEGYGRQRNDWAVNPALGGVVQ